ncbi:MAG: PBP1A family penicillin-binding protein [Helicobacteraceae bacterium]|nr:PBP1A family penicillin-binding protein [Helicobacteraceae bacterium]
MESLKFFFRGRSIKEGDSAHTSKLEKLKKTFLVSVLVTLSIAVIGITILTVYLVRALSINTDPLVYFHPKLTTQFYDRNGELIANLFVDEHRIYVPFEQIPSRMVEALVAIEDTSFFEHYGINPEAIGRATYKVILAGRAVEGASTITQQLVKNLLLSREKTLDRKLTEAILALRVEMSLTKEQILERYFNDIYMGHGYYGVRTAALGYFRKDLDQLTMKEIAMLAGIPRLPNFYDPTKNLQDSIARANLVLERMMLLGWISEDEYKTAITQVPEIFDDTLTRNKAPYAIDAIVKHLSVDFPDIRSGGYTVYTTIDLAMQKTAEAAIKKGYDDIKTRVEDYCRKETDRYNALLADRNIDPAKRKEEMDKISDNLGSFIVRVQPSADNNFTNYAVNDELLDAKLSQLNGALVTIKQQTGDLLALVGGADYSKSVFNRAYQSKRQLGSSFKPFIYLSAFDLGYSPASPIADISRTYKYADSEDKEEKIWRPTNFDDNFVGLMTVRDAVVVSRNLATINLVETIGLSQLFDQLSSYLPKPLIYDMTIALGAHSLSPFEFAEYWTVISNYGERMKIRVATEVIDRYGASKLYESEGVLVTKPEQAYLMINVLQDAVRRGTGRRARVANIEIAGKTGTTNDSRDAWFVGFTPDTETIVWYGNDDDSSMGPLGTGAGFSAPVFGDYYRELIKVRPELKRRFDRPAGVLEVDMGNGKKEVFTSTSKQPKRTASEATGSDSGPLF